ncbi:MAG: MFS transporter [Alphaproteobacteria bacterium]|nr:MFS transporter [Alphaproteobacteria bacterium]
MSAVPPRPAARAPAATPPGWRESLALYADPRLLVMLALGFAAGLPLPLTGFTLRQWMSEAGVSLSGIGATALIGIAYSFKFVWSPLIDHLPLPPFTALLGRRRGWLLPIQLLLALAIALLGQTDPARDATLTVAVAVAVAFLSASQDIVIDAYRIEILPPERQGAGLAAYVWGYRIALLAANAGALFLVGRLGWRGAYAVVALLMVVGIAATLLGREPAREPAPEPDGARGGARGAGGIGAWFARSVAGPFADFARRDGWVLLLAFVALFKLGEALAGIMTAPFYRALGFTREEVAAISSVFGLVATLAGVTVGGAVVHRLGLFRALMLTGVMQMLSNLMYVALAHSGRNLAMLWAQVGVESFTDGLADAAFVAYLSALTSRAFTATQYALLSSLASVPLRTLGGSSGVLAAALGWPRFFLLTTAAALPALLIALVLQRRFAAAEHAHPGSRPRAEG